MSGAVRRSSELAVVERDDHAVILDLRRLDDPDPIQLDGTALTIWRAIDGRRDRAAIVAAVASAHGVEPTVVEPDVATFLDDLARRGILISA